MTATTSPALPWVSPRGQLSCLLAIVLAWANGSAFASDQDRVEAIVQGKCFICHGMNGESSTPSFPRLAGQDATYTARQLADYKSGKRRSDTMQPMVVDLSEKDFALLGAYFAAQPTVAHAVKEPELVPTGKQLFTQGKEGGSSCASCHGESAKGSEGSPRLAGQHAQYLVTQLQQFQRRERPQSAVMGKVAAKLNESDMKAVAAYLSGLK
jgi:cytochrome c553